MARVGCRLGLNIMGYWIRRDVLAEENLERELDADLMIARDRQTRQTRPTRAVSSFRICYHSLTLPSRDILAFYL